MDFTAQGIRSLLHSLLHSHFSPLHATSSFLFLVDIVSQHLGSSSVAEDSPNGVGCGLSFLMSDCGENRLGVKQAKEDSGASADLLRRPMVML
jgi:hypothetical protein